MRAFGTADRTSEFQKRKELETSSPCKETNDLGGKQTMLVHRPIISKSKARIEEVQHPPQTLIQVPLRELVLTLERKL